MTQLIPFNFEQKEIRVIANGSTWFVAQDVCDAIGIKNARQAVAVLDDNERRMLNIHPQGDTWGISESGLYTLILRSRKAVTSGTPQHRFRKWVTSELLPAVRQGHLTPTHQVPATIDMNALQTLIVQEVSKALAPLKLQVQEAVVYKSGTQKGNTKEVATGKQAGRIISQMADVLDKIDVINYKIASLEALEKLTHNYIEKAVTPNTNLTNALHVMHAMAMR